MTTLLIAWLWMCPELDVDALTQQLDGIAELRLKGIHGRASLRFDRQGIHSVKIKTRINGERWPVIRARIRERFISPGIRRLTIRY